MSEFLYDDEFCKTRSKHRKWQSKMGFILGSFFDIKSVVDFGCSIGTFLEGFQQAGSEILGYELGYKYSRNYTSEEVLPFINEGDVTKFINCSMFDCTFSIEVAEHIDPKGTEMFIKNLCEHSSRYIIMSAASIGQGGVGHINCMPYSFWINAIECYGFKHQPETTEAILKEIEKETNVPSWITKNLMIFEKL